MPNSNFQQTPFLQSGSPITENRPMDGLGAGQLGSRFTFIDPADNVAKRHQLIQADSVMDVVPYAGAVAYWLANTGYLVTTDVSVAGRGNVAGVFTTAVTLGYVGCIQIKGKGPADVDTGTPLATGLFVVPSASDGKATVIAAGSPATYPALGRSVSATAISNTVYPVELDLPGRE